MKHITLLILALQLLSSAYTQHTNPTKQDDWVTDVATVEFEQGEIYYTHVDEPEYFAFLRPPYFMPGAFIMQTDINRPFTKNPLKKIFTDLDNFVEGFEIENSDIYDKNLFIRAATLEMIWSSYSLHLFTENTYLKLKALSQDKTTSVANKASLALKLHNIFSKSKSIKLEHIKNNSTSEYLSVQFDSDKLIFELNAISGDVEISIFIEGINGNLSYKFEGINPNEKTIIKNVELRDGMYLARLIVNGKEMESIKFTIVK